MPIDLNTKEVSEKIDRPGWINEEIKGLKVEIENVEPVHNSSKPCFKVVYRTADKTKATKIIIQRYYLTEKAHWKLAVLMIACGLYEIRKDENGKDKKHFPPFEPKILRNKTLLVDVELEIYNGQERFKVVNETEIKQEIPSDNLDEY